MKKRSSIVGRRELFYRFGDKEKEAIACFDFLEEIPSVESLIKKNTSPGESPPVPPSNLSLSCRQITSIKERISLVSPTIGALSKSTTTTDLPSKMTDFAKSPFSSFSARKLRLPNLWNKPLSHNMSSSTLNSQDCELLDHISLSDSCAESYSSTPESYDDVSWREYSNTESIFVHLRCCLVSCNIKLLYIWRLFFIQSYCDCSILKYRHPDMSSANQCKCFWI